MGLYPCYTNSCYRLTPCGGQRWDFQANDDEHARYKAREHMRVWEYYDGHLCHVTEFVHGKGVTETIRFMGAF